ncbi:IS30 family transposase [Kitasatospora sp. NPDC004799]|uniref:IS30 family transposase n=1 Tax=Kitasatospora sp. NPDC004799 TaxID=3154460 RepID=UPI0033A7BA58
MDFEIREDRTAQGPVRLSRERAAYSRLMQQGYSNAEACRIVGIDQRTGRKWRNGRGADRRQKAAPPIHSVVPPSGVSRYLGEDERIHIADRLREKATVRRIAAELGRSPSTISREIRRNRTDDTRGQWHYRPHAAQARADARRPRPKPRRILSNPELREAVQAMLDERWSPEQICHALRVQFPDRPEMHVVHETVYQALYIQGRGELRRELAGALRSGRARRIPHRQANCRKPRFIDPMVMISERPAEAEDRAVPGHWEGDLIIGKDGASAIGTLVERHTRYVNGLLRQYFPKGTDLSTHTAECLTAVADQLNRRPRKTLGWETPAERLHKLIAA